VAVLSSLIVNVGSAGPTSFDRDAGHFLHPIAAFDVSRTSMWNSHIATRIRIRQESWNRDATLSAPTSKKRPLWTDTIFFDKISIWIKVWKSSAVGTRCSSHMLKILVQFLTIFEKVSALLKSELLQTNFIQTHSGFLCCCSFNKVKANKNLIKPPQIMQTGVSKVLRAIGNK
jgi:hypothetical protein